MIKLSFANGLPNSSLKVGDLVYYIPNPNQNHEASGFTTGDDVNGVSTHVLIGDCVRIQPWQQDSHMSSDEDIDQTQARYHFHLFVKPSTSYIGQLSLGNGLNAGGGDYIFFMKNNLVEQSSLVGYYNSVLLKNDSKERAELFAVSCNVVESSK